MTDDDGLPYEAVLGRIGEIAEELLAHPDRDVADSVGELLDWVDAFHREGVGRLIEMVRAWRGEIFLESVGADPIVGTLLSAYGLGEGPAAEDAEDLVAAALEEVRPLIESHGGALEVESVVDGVVRVRMLGTCDGCPSSSATLTYGVEAALKEHWPHFRRLEIVDPAAETDPAKADLECVTAPPPPPPARAAPEQLLQIRPYQKR